MEWKVFALATSGQRRYEVPVTADGKSMSFSANVRGTDGNGVLEYELVRDK